MEQIKLKILIPNSGMDRDTLNAREPSVGRLYPSRAHIH